MAIVDTKSDAFDSGMGWDQEVVDPIRSRAKLRGAIGTVACAATDSNGSVYRLWRMPSRAILHPVTVLDLQDWGYAACTVGLARADGATLTANGLLSVADVSALSAVSSPIAAFGAKWGKPIWEAAGLSADPGGLVDVVITTAANATGAGTADFDAVWMID